MSPVAGFVRTRRHQFGRQSALNTPVAAVKIYGLKGTPDIDPQWTDPDVDTGSIDPYESPHREAGDYTAPLTDPSLRYNTLPLLMCGTFGGAVTPTGAGDAKTWVHEPASDGTDEVDAFTYEFGYTDVPSDWEQMFDGIVETIEITGPDGLGALTVSVTWRFGGVNGSGFTDFPDSPAVPTALDQSLNEAIVYLKDMAIFIASDPDDLDTAQISDALHTFTLRITKTVDQKRFANGDQSFNIDDYGVSARLIELECSWAKTSDIVGEGSESDAWFSETSVDRFVRLYAESKEIAETPSTPYSWDISMPMRYYTRSEGDIGGNAVTILTGHAFLDPDGSDTDFGGVFKSTAVTTQATV